VSARIAMSRFTALVSLLLLVSGSGAFVAFTANRVQAFEPDLSAMADTPSAYLTPQDWSLAEPVQTRVTRPASTPVPEPSQAPPTPAPQPATVETNEPEMDSDSEAAPDIILPAWPVATPPLFAPTRLIIPDISVDARIVAVSTTDSGAMETPEDYGEIGWYRLGAVPGEIGRAVLAGHVDSKTGPAVFYLLRDVQPGQIVEVATSGNQQPLRFIVRETAQYPEHDAPLDRIFGGSDRNELILITCAGVFDRGGAGYDQRLVVYAELVPPDLP
jgi:sortase A